MVVKIQPAAASVGGILAYNERKVEQGSAGIVYSRGFPGDSREDRARTFEALQRLSYRSDRVTFHASVNPSVTDSIPPERISEFCAELMERLGYGNQPMVVYRHSDIDREHYHIVSSRVGPDGRKINDDYEHRRCIQIIRELAPKYGYTVQSGGAKEINPSQGFVPGKGDTVAQIEAIFSHALKYNFTTEHQFALVMQSLGVKIEEIHHGADEVSYVFQGLDRRGRSCTVPVEQEDTAIPGRQAVLSAIRTNAARRRDRSVQRVGSIVRSLTPYSTSERHLSNLLRKQGISFHPSRNADGTIFGVTFVDSRTRCAVSGSELGPELSAAVFDRMRRQQWTDPAKDTGNAAENENENEQVLEGIAAAAFGGEHSRRSEDEDYDRKVKEREARLTHIRR